MSTVAAPAIERPAPDEHAPYYSRYIDLVPEGDVLDLLDRQAQDTVGFLRGIPIHLHDHRYAEGKWSVKEVIGHLADTERVFAYRALRFARGDRTELAGFDENAYTPAGEFGLREFESLVEEWLNVRRASLSLFRSLTPEQARRRGLANGQEISVRAIAFIAAGHIIHHTAILRERYLGES
ncbi:DinB family protein [Longimicrobium sp.]|uniref:DinB family protein n=1 Tax=Longimicrobium sp. TaxID=2029185 RepID=UPI002B598327|nr:DinB family protein [Longimicrobium sp.]HSU18019.1 DinB family protein [Longimicrobium sp.]